MIMYHVSQKIRAPKISTESAWNKVPLFSYLTATLFTYHEQKIGMIFINEFSRYNFKHKLTCWIVFVIFVLHGRLTSHKAITKSCKTGLAFEVYIWSHNYKTISANESMFLAGASWKLWHLNDLHMITFFKAEFIGGHTIHWGLIFLGHPVYRVYQKEVSSSKNDSELKRMRYLVKYLF